MSRGEVVDVDLGEPEGHEAGWDHAALIVSDDRLENVGVVIVCPITSTRLGYPSHVEIEPGHSGLAHTSYVQTELVRSISTTRVRRTRGSADFLVMQSVGQRLRLLMRL